MQISKLIACLRSMSLTERKGDKKSQHSLENDRHTKCRNPTRDLVVAGSRGSGKSTLIKQVRIIPSIGFTSCERYQARADICRGFLNAFKEALDVMNSHKMEFGSERAKVAVDLIRQTDENHCSETFLLDWKVCKAMEIVWKDKQLSPNTV